MPYGRIGLIILVVFALAIGGWGIYAGLIRPTTKPNPTEQYAADRMYNKTIHYDYHPVMAFGCMRIPKENEK